MASKSNWQQKKFNQKFKIEKEKFTAVNWRCNSLHSIFRRWEKRNLHTEVYVKKSLYQDLFFQEIKSLTWRSEQSRYCFPWDCQWIRKAATDDISFIFCFLYAFLPLTQQKIYHIPSQHCLISSHWFVPHAHQFHFHTCELYFQPACQNTDVFLVILQYPVCSYYSRFNHALLLKSVGLLWIVFGR